LGQAFESFRGIHLRGDGFEKGGKQGRGIHSNNWFGFGSKGESPFWGAGGGFGSGPEAGDRAPKINTQTFRTWRAGLEKKKKGSIRIFGAGVP